MVNGRLFDADPYAIVDDVAGRVREGYLLVYRGNTLKGYTTDLRLWFRWLADRGIQPLDAERFHIETYDKELESRGSKPATRQRKLIAVCGFYRYAEQEDVLEESPGRYVRRPRVPAVSTSEYLERFELTKFLRAAESLSVRHHALCCLLAFNGLRVSEVTEATIAGLSFNRGHRTLAIVRKGGAEAEVPLAPQTFRAISRAIDGREEGPLILDSHGQGMTRHSASRAVKRAAKTAGINKRLGPHALRHTYISLCLDAGVPLRDMQVDAGHANPATTARYDRRNRSLDRHSTYVLASFVGAA